MCNKNASLLPAQTHENLEHLAMMERVLGPFPDDLVDRCQKAVSAKYFSRGRLAWPGGADAKSVRAVRRLPELRDLLLEKVRCRS